jgi:hypothetical protein
MPLITGSWNSYASGSKDFDLWSGRYDFYLAIMQREQALGRRYWPTPNVIHDEGVIGSMTTTSITDTSKTWDSNRWNAYHDGNGEDQRVPEYYEVVIYADAYLTPWKTVKAFITSNDSNTIHFSDIGLDASDLTTFEGKRYAIIRQFGMWWTERIPQWPNPKTFIESGESEWITNGVVTAYDEDTDTLTIDLKQIPSSSISVTFRIAGTSFTGTTTATTPTPTITFTDAATSAADIGRQVSFKFNSITILQDDQQNWTANEWAGKSVAFYVNGRTRTGTITSNTAKTLTLAGDYVASRSRPSAYAIFIAGGADYILGHQPDQADKWTRGPQSANWSHVTADDLSSQVLWGAEGIAKNSVTWIRYPEIGVIGEPEITTEYLFDRDVITEPVEKITQIPETGQTRANGDSIKTPDYWKTWRAVQTYIEANCSNWLPMIGYGGTQAFQNYVPATLFHALGINSGTGSVTGWEAVYSGGSFDYYATLNLGAHPYTPIGIYWAIIGEGNAVLGSGYLVAQGDGEVVVNGYGMTEEDVGRTVVFSYGWTRKVPNEFRHLFPRTYFEAGYDEDDVLITTPTSDTPGSWITRSASTAYRESKDESLGSVDSLGGLKSSTYGEVIDSSRFPIQNGDTGRFVGANFADTTLTDSFSPDAPSLTEETIEADKGTFDGHTRRWEPRLRGAATDGGNFFLTDSAGNWEQFGSYTAATGTATSGSSTTLTDTSKASDGRWDAATGRWIGWTLTLTKGGITKKTLITGFSGTTLTFVACGITVDNSTTYSISEPRNILNRFKGRKLQIRKASDQTDHEVTIIANDGTTLFWSVSEGVTVEAGDSYVIDEPLHGTIWERSSGQWIKPTGMTSQTATFPNGVKVCVGRPDVRVQYGRAMKNDYSPDADQVAEVKAAISALQWTQDGYSWVRHKYATGSDGAFTGEAFCSEGQGESPQHSFDTILNGGFLFRCDGTDIYKCGAKNEYQIAVNYGGPDGCPPISVCNPIVFCDTNADPVQEGTGSGPPSASSAAFIDSTNGGENSVGLSRNSAYGRATKTTLVAASMDFYNYGRYSLIDAGDIESEDVSESPYDPVQSPLCAGINSIERHRRFNAMGDPVAWHRWTNWTSTGANTDATVDTSSMLGTFTQPPEPSPTITATDGCTVHHNWEEGYIIGNQIVVKKWSMSYV